MALMVGSSWNAADSSGLAPIRSPAATVSVEAPAARDFFRSLFSRLARYAAPPAGRALDVAVIPGMLPLEPVGTSRLPWKSLSASRSSLM